MATSTENPVKKIYQSVIDEVIQNVREQFLDEGYDEQFLQELKHMWETKLNSCRAINESENNQARLPIQPAKDNANKNKDNNNTSNGTANGATTTTTTDTTTPAATSNTTNNGGGGNSSIESSTRAAIDALPQSHQPPASKFLNTQTAASATTASIDVKPTHLVTNSKQVDGIDDSSDDDDDEDVLDHISSQSNDDFEDDEAKNDDYEGKEDSDPLNSSDDVSEIDSNELYDTDNVIICQYDKITRIKNRWKFHLKDGVMNINGKDYLFSKATGDAEW